MDDNKGYNEKFFFFFFSPQSGSTKEDLETEHNRTEVEKYVRNFHTTKAKKKRQQQQQKKNL